MRIKLLLGIILWMSLGASTWAQYLGGNGQGYAYDVYSTQDVAFIGSAGQTFTVGDGPTVANSIDVFLLYGGNVGINTTNGIRINIPSDLNMVWDSSVTTATITGSASAKVSSTVSYANTNTTLVLTVTSNFVNGDYIIISGLSFKSFTTTGSDLLTLEVDGTDLVGAAGQYKSIIVPAISGNSYGGTGQGYSTYLYDTQQGQLFYGTGF